MNTRTILISILAICILFAGWLWMTGDEDQAVLSGAGITEAQYNEIALGDHAQTVIQKLGETVSMETIPDHKRVYTWPMACHAGHTCVVILQHNSVVEISSDCFAGRVAEETGQDR